MFKASSLVAAGLAAVRLVNAQSQIAAVTGGAVGSNGDCGGCFVVADVAGIAFGSEVNTATATNQVVVMPGMNSTFTTTSLIFNQAQFTFSPVAGIAPQTGTPAHATPLNVDTSTTVINGVTLTSPTAYNVFTAYTVTSYQQTNGGCRLVAAPRSQLSSAYSVAVPQGVDYNVFAAEAQSSFIDFIGQPSCSAGGENLTPTAIIPQTVTTVSSTTTARATLTPQPALGSSAARATNGPTAPTTRPTSSAYLAGNGTRSIAIAGTGTAFGPGGHSIAIGGADRVRQAGTWFAGAAALLMGFVA